MHIYYCYPIPFHYPSAMTLQVIRDYKSLATLGYRIHLYGLCSSLEQGKQLQDELKKTGISLTWGVGKSSWDRNWIKWRFFANLLVDRAPKILISRNHNTLKEAMWLKPFLVKTKYCLEMHEEAFPHLLHIKKTPQHILKQRYQSLFHQLNGLILTNFSQETILKQEFSSYPKYSILPNGVEIEKFQHAAPPQQKEHTVITYTGQFSKWKNVELIFAAMKYLDKNFILRIAGGKGDNASRQIIENWGKEYQVLDRIDYRGYIAPENLVKDVLDGSSALLLPLGDNMESRYFTSPMILFEYMATKIPVVAVDYPSVQGITGEHSVFLSPSHPQEFAFAIQEAVRHPHSDRIAHMNAIARHYSYHERSQRFDAFLKGM